MNGEKMKFTLIIDPERQEEVVVYAHRECALSEKIENLVKDFGDELFGYRDLEAVRLDVGLVSAFTVEDGKVFAVTADGRFLVRERLYQLEERYCHAFVKINQSCLVNVDRIERFNASIGGSLMVSTKDGYRDYISRRQLKAVKERIGF